jgi:hypothetical protein
VGGVNGIPTEKALRVNSAAIIGGVGAAAAADIPKEGKYDITNCWSGIANSRNHRGLAAILVADIISYTDTDQHETKIHDIFVHPICPDRNHCGGDQRHNRANAIVCHAQTICSQSVAK